MSREKGDDKIYVSLITEYKSMMYRIAYGYLDDETKAMDAVDEAVYLGYLHRKELREQKYLKTWLTRILINECYKVLRKDKREIITDVLPEKSDQDNDYSLPLKIAIQDLPEDLRKAIVLRYFGDYTIADTAEILNIPEGTVSTRTRKALELLRIDIDE